MKNLRRVSIIFVIFILVSCDLLSACSKNETKDTPMKTPDHEKFAGTIVTKWQIPEDCIPEGYYINNTVLNIKSLMFGNTYFPDDSKRYEEEAKDYAVGYSKEIEDFGKVDLYIGKVIISSLLENYIDEIQDVGAWMYTFTHRYGDPYPEIPDDFLKYGDVIVVRSDYWVFLYAYKMKNGGVMEIRMGVPVTMSNSGYYIPDGIDYDFEYIINCLLETEQFQSEEEEPQETYENSDSEIDTEEYSD